MIHTLNRSQAIDSFREALLLALDAAARDAFGNACDGRMPGATDADLPRLFRAIDSQVDTLAQRYGIRWEDSDNAQ